MSFTKLKDRIDKLPLVLAGPIVRRVEPDSASVWVALRRRRRVRLEVHDSAGVVVARGERETVAVGANLHIACVTAKPSASFAAGTTYQYELFFDHIGGTDNIVSGSGLFSPRIVSASDVTAVAADEARAKLTYASDGGPPRPSFVLPPPALDQLRLLHGSCRKVSGEHSDALEAADHILRDAIKNNGRRPHMLFLTGDNIYNDGCERESFKVILDAAPTLLGWDESMQASGKLSGMSEIRFGYALDDAGLSNTGKYYHLFGLGETIALYLLSLVDVLWPDDLNYQRGTFDFRGTLPAVRRALANVATYAIFDDHEFSNSWNLTADWVESVLGSAMGRRVYQNALAAYALCHGWGNTPDQFKSGPGKALLDAIVDWSTAERAGTSSPSDPLARIGQSTGIPDRDTFRGQRDWSRFHGPEVVRWDYTIPCPGLNIDVLDAYMWRAYEGATTNALILPETALDRQIDQAKFPHTECSLVVVSNVAITLPGKGGRWTPLSEFGWGLLTALGALLFPVWLVVRILQWLVGLFISRARASLPTLHSLARFASPLYREEYGSSFEHQTKGFELLMARVAHRAPQVTGQKRQARVVLLSGDLHYSFCMRMEYWSRIPFGKTAEPVEGVIAQLISSPSKWVNPTEYKLKNTGIHHWAGWSNEPTLTWTSQPKESPWRFKESPWMTEYTPGSNQPLMNPDPEWRYSLKLVELSPSSNQEPMEIPDRPDPTLNEQWAELKLVASSLLKQLEQAHVLKVNNLADVTFDWTSSQKTVTQSVWWRGRPAVDQKWTISRYEISMDPPASPPLLPR